MPKKSNDAVFGVSLKHSIMPLLIFVNQLFGCMSPKISVDDGKEYIQVTIDGKKDLLPILQPQDTISTSADLPPQTKTSYPYPRQYTLPLQMQQDTLPQGKSATMIATEGMEKIYWTITIHEGTAVVRLVHDQHNPETKEAKYNLVASHVLSADTIQQLARTFLLSYDITHGEKGWKDSLILETNVGPRSTYKKPTDTIPSYQIPTSRVTTASYQIFGVPSQGHSIMPKNPQKKPKKR